MHPNHNRPTGDRGASYVRVSDEIQDTARQHTSNREWASRNGLAIIQTFEDPGGRRHKAESRPGFQSLLKAVEAGLIDWIVVDNQDRLGFKGPFEWYHFLYIFQKYRVELWQSVDNKLLSSEDVASVVTTGIGAHGSKEEMVKKASRDLGKKKEMARSGEWPGGYIPYGLDVVCFDQQGREKWRVITEGHWQRLQVYPDQRKQEYNGKDNFPKDRQLGDRMQLVPSCRTDRLDVVRQMFAWFDSESLSLNAIGKRLNKLGIRPVSTSGQWYAVLVKGMLLNPVYVGKPAYNKNAHGLYAEYDPHVGISTSPPRHADDQGKAKTGRKRERKDWILPEEPIFPPIVDPELWERVQKKLTDSPKRARASRSDDLWLSGLLFCAKCNKPMVGWATPNEAQKLSYACGTYRRHGIDNDFGCRLHRINHDHMLKIIEDYLSQTSTTIQVLESIGSGKFESMAFAQSQEYMRSYNAVLRRIEEIVVVSLADHYQAVDGTYTVGDWVISVVEGRLRHLNPGQVIAPEWYVEVYDRILSEQFKSRAEKLRQAESEFHSHYEVFMRSTSTLAKEFANREMTRLDATIQALKTDTNPLSAQLLEIGKQWVGVVGRIQEARRADKGNQGRRYAEVIRQIIERIDCSFEYRDCGSQLRSKLSGVEIHPLIDVPSQALRNELSLEPG